MAGPAGALSGVEWLQAARALLGDAPDQELRLVDVQPHGEPLGLVGECVRVAVRVRGGSEAQGEERRALLFLKTAPSASACPTRAALCADSLALRKEAALHALLARLRPRLRAAHALQPWGARCLLARPPHLLLFEDLAAQGFRAAEARLGLDFAHCAAALDALARLHAASLALEEADRRARRPTPWRLGERFPDALEEVAFADADAGADAGAGANPLHRFFASGLGAVRALLHAMHEFRASPRLEEALRRLDALPALARDLARPSDAHRNAICHGAPAASSLLFRYSSWGQVEEARLVDLRQTRYAPPALDVSVLLHCCARRALREARGAELRDVYHAALTRALAAAGFPASEALLSRAAFDASWAACAPFGAVVAACALPVACLPERVLAPLRRDPDALARFLLEDRARQVEDEFQRDADYRERVGEAVAALVHEVLLRK